MKENYPCPVCGYLVFPEPPGSYDICPICDWEDDGLQLEFATTLDGGANHLTLYEAQRQYAEAATRLQRKQGISSLPRARDTQWRPIDPSRDHFPAWEERDRLRAPSLDETLYYWRETFWNRASAR